MRHGWAWALPAAALLAIVTAPLVRPDRVLAVRDIATFHLPLRTVFRALVLDGILPSWNPLLHAGQPILSNPNYAAFYPVTWLLLPLPASWAIGLLVVVHAAWGAVGAWRLLRALGCEPPAAGLGALAWVGSSWFLSLPSTLNFFVGTSWAPWVFAAGLRAIEGEGSTRRRAIVLLATGVTLQLFAGEPVAVLISAVGLGCLAVARRPRALLAALVPAAALAALLAAVQIVPTVGRVRDSVRAELDRGAAMTWSSRPERVVELLYPRIWGDPMRDEEGLWLGWRHHDQDFPYVISPYAGGLAAILALSLFGTRPPTARGWGLAAAAGLFLALGRYNPAFPPLAEIVPLLGWVRYPEKFLVLTGAAVSTLAGLGWQALLDARRRGEVERANLPATLAVVAAAVAASVAWTLRGADAAVRLVRGQLPWPIAGEAARAAGDWLRREWWIEAAIFAMVALLLLGWRRRRLSESWLGAFAVFLLIADLGWRGLGLLPTLPTGQLLDTPLVARQVAGSGARLHVELKAGSRRDLEMRVGPVGFQQLFGRIARLEPYTGLLWDVPYALHADYDLMRTRWGTWAQRRFELSRGAEGVPSPALLAAWNVGWIAVKRAPAELVAEWRRTGRRPAPAELYRNPAVRPRYRFVGRVGVADPAQAASAAVAPAEAVEAVCLAASDRPPLPVGRRAPARVLAVAEHGGTVRVSYRASGPATLVVAVTHDAGWIAEGRDGGALPLCVTSLGQMAVDVPAGAGEILLRYRERSLPLGAALSGLGLVVSGLVLVSARRA